MHTPTQNANRTPWTAKRIGKNLYIETEDQNALTPFVADLQFPDCQSDEEREVTLANADLIVRAVNSHDALVEALELCKRKVEGQLYMLPVDASEEKDILSAWIGRINGALTLAKKG